MENKIMPARLTDEKTGTVYELDFNRESIVFTERHEFNLTEAVKYPVTGMRDLFYYSFRKNHRNIARDKTDSIFDRWGGGLPEKLAVRLINLYKQAQTSNAVSMDEESEKNSGMTLEL